VTVSHDEAGVAAAVDLALSGIKISV